MPNTQSTPAQPRRHFRCTAVKDIFFSIPADKLLTDNQIDDISLELMDMLELPSVEKLKARRASILNSGGNAASINPMVAYIDSLIEILSMIAFEGSTGLEPIDISVEDI